MQSLFIPLRIEWWLDQTGDLINKSIKVEIKRLKNVCNRSVLVESEYQRRVQKPGNEVNTNNKLKGKFTYNKADKIRPNIIIYGTIKKMGNKEFIKSLEY